MDADSGGPLSEFFPDQSEKGAKAGRDMAALAAVPSPDTDRSATGNTRDWAVIPSRVGDLQFLPAAGANLHRDRASQFFEQLRSRFSYVVIKLPKPRAWPLDWNVGENLDAVVLAADYQYTPRGRVRAALDALKAAGAELAGCVLTNWKDPVPGGVYSLLGVAPEEPAVAIEPSPVDRPDVTVHQPRSEWESLAAFLLAVFAVPAAISAVLVLPGATGAVLAALAVGAGVTSLLAAAGGAQFGFGSAGCLLTLLAAMAIALGVFSVVLRAAGSLEAPVEEEDTSWVWPAARPLGGGPFGPSESIGPPGRGVYLSVGRGLGTHLPSPSSQTHL